LEEIPVCAEKGAHPRTDAIRSAAANILMKTDYSKRSRAPKFDSLAYDRTRTSVPESSATRQLYSSKQFGVVFGVGTRKRACGSESSSVDCIFAHRQWASTTWLRSRLSGQVAHRPVVKLAAPSSE